MHTFNFGIIFSETLRLWKKLFSRLLIIPLLCLPLYLVESSLPGSKSILISSLFKLFEYLFYLYLSALVYKAAVLSYENGPLRLRELFTLPLKTYLYFILASFLTSLVIGFGLILLIIPGHVC